MPTPPQSSWDKYYAERGLQRPPLTEIAPVKSDGGRAAAGGAAGRADQGVRQLGTVTAVDEWCQVAETESRRLRTEWVFIGVMLGALFALALVVGLVEFSSSMFGGKPPRALLSEQAAKVADEVLRRANTTIHPLTLESVNTKFAGHPDARHADYQITVTLRLRVDLYAPADSNGAQTYLRLQRSVAEAHGRAVRHFGETGPAAMPELVVMPPLIAVAHRKGERLAYRIPIEYSRAGRAWQMEIRAQGQWHADRPLVGMPRDNFPAQSLVFGTPEDRVAVREKCEEACRYVIAVNKALVRITVPNGGQKSTPPPDK